MDLFTIIIRALAKFFLSKADRLYLTDNILSGFYMNAFVCVLSILRNKESHQSVPLTTPFSYSKFSLLFLISSVMIRSTANFVIFNKKFEFQARLLERTPSMSDLNQVIFGQVRSHSSIRKTSLTPGIGSCLFYCVVATQCYLINQFFR